MMVEDRAGNGPQALQDAVVAMIGRAAQTPGLQQVFSLFETQTPQLYLDIDRTKAQLLGVNVADVFALFRCTEAMKNTFRASSSMTRRSGKRQRTARRWSS